MVQSVWSCDFETTTDELDCRIWAWGAFNLNSGAFKYGNDFRGFFDWMFSGDCARTLYFHNLAFDGEFIIHNLFLLGFEHDANDRTKMRNNTFRTLISEEGIFYTMKIMYNGCIINIFDSLKILKNKVAILPKTFGLDESKGEIDYHKNRPLGYIPTNEEIDYLYYDVKIVADALNIMFENGINKMTLPSSALHWYKKQKGEKLFDDLFPTLDESVDSFIRRSYKGGFTWLNPKFKNKIINGGEVFDVNSLYPAMMRTKPLPYGEPVYFEGQYKNDKLYPLYVQGFFCRFHVKKNHIPTLQLKHTFRFSETEYLTKSIEEQAYICLTSVDLKLFFDHYNVWDIEYAGGYKFMSTNNLFTDYVDYWTQQKIKASEENNKGMRTIAKLMQNSLYGKFGTNPKGRNKIPHFEDNRVVYNKSEEANRKSLYIPVATFITSYARDFTIRSAQACFSRFIYADTDSLHIEGHEKPDIEIHPTKLGKWKNELTFQKAKYLRSKCYMEYGKDPEKDEDYNWKITVAGMPDSCYSHVTIDNFNYGAKYAGKKTTKRVQGGIVISEIMFTIKQDYCP